MNINTNRIFWLPSGIGRKELNNKLKRLNQENEWKVPNCI